MNSTSALTLVMSARIPRNNSSTRFSGSLAHRAHNNALPLPDRWLSVTSNPFPSALTLCSVSAESGQDSRSQLIGGGLFTRDFLIEGITTTPRWESIGDDRLSKIQAEAISFFTKLTSVSNPSEAVTEKYLIYPLLEAVGWGDRVFVQPNASLRGRADVPDALLFADEASHDL